MTTRHRLVAGLAAAVALICGLAALSARGSDTADAALGRGPTATAERRTLQTTVAETGVLERTDTRTITYSGALESRTATSDTPSATDSATTGPVPSGRIGSDPETGGDAAAAPDGLTGSAGADTDSSTPTSSSAEETEADNTPDPTTLTGIAEIGALVTRGTVLYSVDDTPVVAFVGDVPHWREITYGVPDGDDIRQLEENLAALGYGDELAVDDTYDDETARAIAAWESDIGRASPDVTVDVGDIVFLQGDAVVLGQEVSIGDELQPGTAVLAVGTAQQVIASVVAADQAATWAPGTEVDLEWSDGSHTTGTVFGTGRDVTDDQVDLLVAIDETDSARLTGSEVTLTVVDDARPDVLAVPVSAIVDGPDGRASVRVPSDSDTDEIQPVTLGLIADGWAEITDGLEEGTEVRLPG